MALYDNTDKELVSNILSGDTQAFKVIISNTQRLVISIIYKMIQNREDRRDLTQEVYLKVFDKLASFKFNSKLSTWIGTITYNTCIKHLEKKNIPILNVVKQDGTQSWEFIERQFPEFSTNQSETSLLNNERSQILTEEIAKLPPLYRTLITLYHQQEQSYKEIMVITELTEGTVKSYLYRARKQLKINLLKKYRKEDL